MQIDLAYNDLECLYEFQYWTQKFSYLVDRLGLRIKCDPESIRPYFRAAPISERKKFIAKIRFYSQLIASAEAENIDIMKDKAFLWKSFSQIGLLPNSDLFSQIHPGDYIEVYDSEGVQLFANFEFLSLISYSFEEILWWSWDQLFARDPRHTETMMVNFTHCFTQALGPFVPSVEDHICWETRSETPKKALVTLKMFAPLFARNKKPMAMLATSKIQLLI